MKVIIDIDGTICEEGPTFERSLAKPKRNAVGALHLLKWAGYHITLYTARSWSEYAMTEEWLKRHAIPYDLLICGKPVYDLWIDDRAMKFTSWAEVWENLSTPK
jgi:uncharacterized HAD superfamily protein